MLSIVSLHIGYAQSNGHPKWLQYIGWGAVHATPMVASDIGSHMPVQLCLLHHAGCSFLFSSSHAVLSQSQLWCPDV